MVVFSISSPPVFITAGWEIRMKYFTQLVIDYVVDIMKICRHAQPRALQINHTKKKETQKDFLF